MTTRPRIQELREQGAFRATLWSVQVTPVATSWLTATVLLALTARPVVA